MLKPNDFDRLPLPIMRTVNQFQNKIVEYIATDLGKFDELATIEDFDNIKHENIQKFNVFYQREVARIKKKLDKEVEDMILLFIIDDMLDEEESKKAGIKYIAFKDDKYINKATNDALKTVKTDINGTLNNLGFTETVNDKTRTLSILPTGYKTQLQKQGFYQKIMDRTANDIYSGKVDYNTAIRQAVRTMTDSGIRDIQYPHHTDRIDVAVRRSVMTQLKGLSRNSEEYKAKRLGLTTFEITWHPQHRPSHQWGGKRFSKVKTDEIDLQTGKPFLTEQELYEKYPSPDGEIGTLEDFNCRHSIFYIYPFDEPLYSQKELDKKDEEQEETRKYKGEEFNPWQARERQRAIERTIRNWRLRAKGYEKTPLQEDILKARGRIMLWRKEYESFNKHFRLKSEWERITYDSIGRVSPLGSNQIKELEEISPSLADKLT